MLKDPDYTTAFKLVGLTLAYNIVEAAVAIWAGVAAGSIALLGFGLDSIIEFSASGTLLLGLAKIRHGASATVINRIEHRMHRFVGVTFLALAFYVGIESASTLYRHEHPSESPIGIALAILSLVVMPYLAFKKLRVARILESPALRAEAKETLACSYLSAILLFGLLANAVGGWWWADPVAALLMIPWLIKEGFEGLRGETKCCA